MWRRLVSPSFRRFRCWLSGHVHASVLKALGLLGVGRRQVRTFAADASGRLDLDTLDASLAGDGVGPAIVIATAGEPNSGAFDPVGATAEVAAAHGAWLHVDGAFGLFAATSPATRGLLEGIDRARSVSVDGHKWLNVPYDCGAAFIDDPGLHQETFTSSAAYLGSDPARPPDVRQPRTRDVSPRARPGCVGDAARLRTRWLPVDGRTAPRARTAAGRQIDAEPDLERLVDVPPNVVCFRYHPRDKADDQLDKLNRRLGEAILQDGHVYFGTTVYAGKVARSRGTGASRRSRALVASLRRDV
jgi:glutamate/tyrosine decarboxylase-like PLP-dependent enzyme